MLYCGSVFLSAQLSQLERGTHKPEVGSAILPADTMKKIQYFTLRIFLFCMFITAGMFLSIIWEGGPDSFGLINKLTFTTFVLGFAAFLVWIVTIILEIRDRIEKKQVFSYYIGHAIVAQLGQSTRLSRGRLPVQVRSVAPTFLILTYKGYFVHTVWTKNCDIIKI